MGRRGQTEGTWDRRGLPQPLHNVIALAVVLGLASAAFVITDQSPSATPTGSVEPTATVQADDEIASEPRIAWESIPRGDERVAVLYAIKGEREALAVIGPDRRAHRCYTGRVLALGDFVGDVVLFTQEGDLYSIDAGCDRDPTLLVDAQSISAGGEYPSIYCPSFSPDGRHIVFSLLGQTGPLLWRVEADGTDPVALGPTPACGWIGQEHVLAFGWSTVDPYAVSIDPKRHARVLRDPHRWRAAVSADGTRIVRAPAGWADWQVEGGSGVSHIEPRVSWNCAGEGASGLTPDISWVENSSRRSVWHPSHPWFLYFDHRDRALVLDDGAQLLDEIELGSCSDYPGHSIAWFGNRALIRFEPHDVGTFGARAMEVYDFRTDGFETIPLRGKVERCCLEELLSVRSLVIPVPEDPFLPASELRPIVRPDLGFTMKLPTTWRIADCYQECRRWDGWRESAHVQGPEPTRGSPPVAIITVDRAPHASRAYLEKIVRDRRKRVTCDEPPCAKIAERSPVSMGGIRFLRLLVTLNNDLDVYLIGRRTNGGSLIFVTDGDELRQDLTLRLGFGSIAFASSAER